MKNTNKGFSRMAFLVVAMIIGIAAYYYLYLQDEPMIQDQSSVPSQTPVSTSTVRNAEYDATLLQ